MKTDVVLLPGLHGSIALFETFVALAPPWARCRPVALPTHGLQTFDALADTVETHLRALETFVLVAESFSAPIAARLSHRLHEKVTLLVLCNPLIEAPPLSIPGSIGASFIHSRWIPTWAVSLAMTGGNRHLASALLGEVRSLPGDILASRLDAVSMAHRDDLLIHLQAPLLGIAGSLDRLLPSRTTEALIESIPYAVYAQIEAPHLVVQSSPAPVWRAISEEFESAA